MSVSLYMYDDESEGMSNDMHHFAFVCVICDILAFDGVNGVAIDAGVVVEV